MHESKRHSNALNGGRFAEWGEQLRLVLAKQFIEMGSVELYDIVMNMPIEELVKGS